LEREADVAKKSSPRKSKKKKSGQTLEKLIIEIDVKSFNDSPVYYFGSWRIKKDIRKRRK
jgi:hypothetical protein